MICVKKSAAGATLKKSKNLNFLFGEGWVGSQRCLRGRVMNVWRHVESVGWTNRDSWLRVKKINLTWTVQWNWAWAGSNKQTHSMEFANGSLQSRAWFLHLHGEWPTIQPLLRRTSWSYTSKDVLGLSLSSRMHLRRDNDRSCGVIIIVQSCHHHQRREPGEVVKKKLGKIEGKVEGELLCHNFTTNVQHAVTAVAISY